MNDDDPGPVHQLMLGLKAGEGVSLVGHSMPSDSDALPWQRRLEQHERARLLPWKKEPPPKKALSYYRFGDHAVVLRRWADGGSLGRSDAHALIGPAEILTVPVALGLDSGFDWKGAAADIKTSLPSRELRTRAEAEVTAGLQSGAASTSAMLRRALGGLIDAGSKPLTIIGCPDEDRVALTWALVHVGHEYLARTSRIRRSWTFSTYEIEDTDGIPDLPEILFMPGKPIGRGVANREIVDVSRDDTLSSEASSWSSELTERFISRKPLFTEFDDIPVISATETVPSSSGVQEPSAPTARPNQIDKSPPEPQLPSQVPATQHSDTQRLERELDRLLAIEDRSLFEQQLKALGEKADERTKIRQILSADRYVKIVMAIERLCSQVADMVEPFQRLRVATFGFDGCDLSSADVVAYALQLIEHPAAHDVFVHGLAQQINAHDQQNRVDPILAARWRAQHDPSARRYRLPRTAKNRQPGTVASLLGPRRWPLAVAGIALLASLIFVVVIYSLNAGTPETGPSGPGTPTTQPITQPPAGGQPAGEAEEPVEVSGGVAAHNLVISGPWRASGEKTVAFLLLKPVSDAHAYYPQGECRIAEQSWHCENLPLVVPPGVRPPLGILVVRISPQDKAKYLDSMKGKTPLQEAPIPADVMFKDSGRS